MALKVYRIPFSTNVERVSLAAGHKGLEIDWVDIPEDDRAEVVRVSGQELVPVLDDDCLILSDSPAILEYLEEQRPEPPLLPAEPAARAEIRIFCDWFNRVGSALPTSTRTSSRSRSRTGSAWSSSVAGSPPRYGSSRAC